jgi:hypothetical protein
MPVAVMAGVMADIAVTGVGMLPNMPQPAILRAANTLRAAANTRGPREAMRAMQWAHVIGMAGATGEAVIGMAAVTGEAITGIRPMDILAWAITAMAIHPTGLARTVTMVGTMVRTTDTTRTSTDIGRP